MEVIADKDIMPVHDAQLRTALNTIKRILKATQSNSFEVVAAQLSNLPHFPDYIALARKIYNDPKLTEKGLENLTIDDILEII